MKHMFCLKKYLYSFKLNRFFTTMNLYQRIRGEVPKKEPEHSTRNGKTLAQVCEEAGRPVSPPYLRLAQNIVYENNFPTYKGDMNNVQSVYNKCWQPYYTQTAAYPEESGIFRAALRYLLNQ